MSPGFPDGPTVSVPDRGCHTALSEVAKTWKGTTWFIEGDISDCFGSLDQESGPGTQCHLEELVRAGLSWMRAPDLGDCA